MNLDQITTKCWILALFERDDGERLLLGDGWFDFKDSLQHFQPNNIASDIVELQGTDGQLLAGQVRRTASQSFDGYVGDALTSKTEIENRRRQFIQFFRVRRFYKVIYIFPDGSAIQRKRGYLTDAPSVPEMWQKFPEYHVALNFEDVSYYEYSEDEQGKEIYANTALIELLNLGIGGLVWDSVGAVSHGYTWLEPVTLTGDYITISDGLDSAPLSLQTIYGDTEQTTYSGKNLANLATFTQGYVASDGRAETSATQGEKYSEFIKVSPSTTYTFKIFATTSTYQAWFGVGEYTSNSFGSFVIRDTNTNTSATSITFTTSSTTNYVVVSARNLASATEVQLEKSSSATSYEPYVGGTASPNPDYPQAIDVVTGEQTVRITGKNLFDVLSVGEVADHLVNNQDGSITVTTYSNNTFVNNGKTLAQLCPSLRVGDTVTLSATSTGTGKLIYLTDGGGSWNFGTSKTITSVMLAGKVCFYASGVSTTATISDIQIELGSQATAYEPFTSQSQEVNLGKNLLTPRTGQTSNGLTGTVNADGSIHISGTASSNWANFVTITSEYLPAGTYTFSVGLTSRPCYVEMQLQMTDNTWKTLRATPTSNYMSVTFDLPIKQVRMNTAYMTVDNEYDFTIYPMLEYGQIVPTTYAPYFTPIELAKIGTYQDRIYKDDGKWYIEKQTGKVVFDGSADETWAIPNSGTANWFYRFRYIADYNSSALNSTFLCNLASYANISSNNTDKGACAINTTGEFRVRYGTEDTLANWKAKLASSPMIVYYALATPTTTEITDATLLEQLEHIYSLYEGVDHISITPTAGAQGTMEVKYYTVLDTTGAGYEWEPGGGSSTTTVEVAGIDNAEPIWTVTGPATNPTLTNITTGQAITWNGTVPAGQTLTVDMGEQTATLAGANVYQFISGSWITLRPGPNKLSYSATGGAEDPSQLEWNGVVG